MFLVWYVLWDRAACRSGSVLRNPCNPFTLPRIRVHIVERALPESRTLEPTTMAANDDEHERTYSGFLVVVAIAVVHVAGVLIGLATGGVLGDWVAAA
jgi:Bacterial aa3 type cytochrome c oxidase subunit IV